MALARKLAYLAGAIRFQWLPLEAVRAVQLRKLKAMLAFCESRVPLYRETFRKAGVGARDLVRLEDLAHFPTLTREEVVGAYPDGISYRRPRPGDVVFRTSGTSGLFMEIAYSERANDFLDAIYMRALLATGYRPWHRFAYFWWEAHPKPTPLHERLGLNRKDLVPVDPDPRVQLARLRELQPHAIYHFPSSMILIAKVVEQERITDLRPRRVICHGELMPDETRREISRILGCPVYNQYGAQELNRLGWDCQHHAGLHADADSAVLEVLADGRPAGPGQEGELVWTGLENELMPLVRYRIGDAGRRLDRRCPCGRGLPLFEITEGRLDDVLTLPGGRRIGPRTLAPRIEELRGFTQYRVVQKRPDALEVLIVPEPGAPGDVDAAVKGTVERLVGPGVQVRVERVTAIPLSRRGKLRKIVSETADGELHGGTARPVRGT